MFFVFCICVILSHLINVEWGSGLRRRQHLNLILLYYLITICLLIEINEVHLSSHFLSFAINFVFFFPDQIWCTGINIEFVINNPLIHVPIEGLDHMPCLFYLLPVNPLVSIIFIRSFLEFTVLLIYLLQKFIDATHHCFFVAFILLFIAFLLRLFFPFLFIFKPFE